MPRAILIALGLYLAAFAGSYFGVGLAAAADRAFAGSAVRTRD